MIFVPAEHTDKQITEVDADWVLSLVGTQKHVDVAEALRVSLASERYKVFQKNRTCVVCGIIGNRMFLEPNPDTDDFCFHLYAETKSRPENETHMVLMTTDHIVPRCKGGSYGLENLQTMCVVCNWIKGETELPVETLKNVMMLAYRSYKSSVAIRKTREVLGPLYKKLQRTENMIRSINLGLPKVVAEASREHMLKRLQQAIAEGDSLRETIAEAEITAQTSGVVPQVIIDGPFKDKGSTILFDVANKSRRGA